MKYQFKATLLKEGNLFTRLINTFNLFSARFITEALYGNDYEIVSVEETI